MDRRSERGASEIQVDDAVVVQSVSHLEPCCNWPIECSNVAQDERNDKRGGCEKSVWVHASPTARQKSRGLEAPIKASDAAASATKRRRRQWPRQTQAQPRGVGTSLS